MQTTITRVFALAAGTTLLAATAAESFETGDRPNVLFIAVDDLRPELGCYGRSHMHTPNIDRLAARGTVFERAYCMVPVCGASRASLMSGLRPGRSRFTTWQASAELEAPDATTLNTHFKKNGYVTVSNGKVFHDPNDNAGGWSEPPWRPEFSGVGYHLPENRKLHAEREELGRRLGRRLRGPAWEAADFPDEQYWDGLVVAKSIDDLRRLAEGHQPFFLALGFFNPHLPFVAPRKYWDLYDPGEIELPENYRSPPRDAPEEALHGWGELRAYTGIPRTGPLTDDQARTLIHGYYACVSHVDAQVGLLMDEFDRLGLAENTIVILWGDHGWSLGEHTLWCKHSCFETSMHSPLIVGAPGMKGGQRTRGLTEFIDIYPSLCELAGLPLPEHLHGDSFAPLLREPRQEWKEAAIGRYRDGDTIRTDQHRFTEYSRASGSPHARMLYDHETDPQENKNVAAKSGNRALVERLGHRLRAAREGSRP